MILGVHMTLMIGPTFAVPAPLAITEALTSVEVTQTDAGRSGFELTLQVGRSGPWDLPDYRLLTHPLLRPFNRVVVVIRFNLLPTVLIDGFITQFDLAPSAEPGALDADGPRRGRDRDDGPRPDRLPVPDAGDRPGGRDPRQVRGPGLDRRGGRPPEHAGPVRSRRGRPRPRTGRDYDYLQELASRHGFVFYVRPGPLPNTNIPYWGRAVPAAAMAQFELTRRSR